MKYKAFCIIFEGLPLKQIKNFFLEGESPTLRAFTKFFAHVLLASGDIEMGNWTEIGQHYKAITLSRLSCS